jgi:dienelactone hydrolase
VIRAIPLAFLFAAAACAQKIDIVPSTVLIDQPAAIRITGVLPNAPVTLQADLIDGAGHPWNSEAQFTADAQGTVDLTQQAPTAGSYHTASAMGLIWSMRPTSKDTHAYAPPHETNPQIIHFYLLVDGKQAAASDLTQTFIAEGVQRVHLEGVLHGTLFLPLGEGKHPGVLVLGGSEGGLPTARAAWLASHGYAALALAYFRYENLPPTLRDIPLEYFGQAISWMSQRPDIDSNRLAVMGTSRGGELALLLGSLYPQIHVVVAYVPANMRHPSCCDRPMGAAWTLHGQPLAWSLPEVRSDPGDVMRSAIAVENIHGPVLMIGAQSDGVWPSADMVAAAADRLRHTHFSYPVVTLIYPHAGHRAGLPEIIPAWNNGVPHPLTGRIVDYGGTPEGNAASTADAIPKVLAFLSQSLGAAQSQPVTPVRSPAPPAP